MRMRTLASVLAAICLLTTSATPAWAEPRHSSENELLVLPLQETKGALQRTALFTMRPNGTVVHRVSSPPWGQSDLDGAWSPDRRQIAFSRDDGKDSANLFVVRADGLGLRQLTRCRSTDEAPCGKFNPVWTPDGRQLIFVDCCSPRDGGFLQNIAVMRTDGSHVRQLTRNNDHDFGDTGPAVSPDGGWVAFSRFVADPDHPESDLGISALHKVRLDGSGLTRLTSYDLIADEKDWSPDGRRIVFTAHLGSNDGPFTADLYTIRPDGRRLQRLTFNDPAKAQASFYPTYSPDGRRIIFGHYPGVDDCADLFVMSAHGGHQRPVTRTPVCEFSADWGT